MIENLNANLVIVARSIWVLLTPVLRCSGIPSNSQRAPQTIAPEVPPRRDLSKKALNEAHCPLLRRQPCTKAGSHFRSYETGREGRAGKVGVENGLLDSVRCETGCDERGKGC